MLKDRDALIANAKKYSTFIYIALALVAVLLMKYLESPEINPNKYGGAEQFGQFGDYIGGILNPIFGFITVLLLLQSATHNQHERMREKNLRDIEALNKLLEHSKENFEKKLKSNIFVDSKNTAISLFLYSFNRDNYSSEIINSFSKAITAVKSARTMQSLSKLEDFDLLHYEIFNIKQALLTVIKHYEKLLELEDFEYAQAAIANQLLNFYLQTIQFDLFTEDETRNVGLKIEKYRHRIFQNSSD